jgi:type II secretion system protein G
MLNRIREAKKNESGFTLIELLIVIVILGILAAIVVFAVGGVTDRGAKAACKSDVKNVEVAVEAYFAQNGTYPTTQALAQAAVVPAFLHNWPNSTNSTITYNYVAGPPATFTVAGDLAGGAVTTDCSA